MIVKVSVPSWGYPIDPREVPFLRQSPGSLGIWGELEFVINKEIDSCDYWVVFDQITHEETCKCPKENTIFITGEPQGPGKYPKVFLDQFSHVISCHKNLRHKNVCHYPSCHPWFLNKSYDELINMPIFEKTKTISLITTKKDTKRYEAALKLKEYFGNRLDVFGIGINPIKEKWEALAPYKYTIVMENRRQDDWITEKLFDSYLALTYPFYCGAPNASKYYPHSTFDEIDVRLMDWTTWIIESRLANPGHYSNYLPLLLNSRNLTLNKYNFFPMIASYIKLRNLSKNSHHVPITISDKGRFRKNALMFLAKSGII